MITEGRRQFIPREEGDQELTQAESTEDARNKTLRFLKRTGMAAVLGAAMLNGESASAQELSSLEKQKMEQVRQQFEDERFCGFLVESISQAMPELERFLSDAKVREVDPEKAGKFGKSEYYIYLPRHHVVLTVPYNNPYDASRLDSDKERRNNIDKGLQEFIGGLLGELVKNGLIKVKKEPTGKVIILPYYRSQGDGESKPKPE